MPPEPGLVEWRDKVFAHRRPTHSEAYILAARKLAMDIGWAEAVTVLRDSSSAVDVDTFVAGSTNRPSEAMSSTDIEHELRRAAEGRDRVFQPPSWTKWNINGIIVGSYPALIWKKRMGMAYHYPIQEPVPRLLPRTSDEGSHEFDVAFMLMVLLRYGLREYDQVDERTLRPLPGEFPKAALRCVGEFYASCNANAGITSGRLSRLRSELLDVWKRSIGSTISLYAVLNEVGRFVPSFQVTTIFKACCIRCYRVFDGLQRSDDGKEQVRGEYTAAPPLGVLKARLNHSELAEVNESLAHAVPGGIAGQIASHWLPDLNSFMPRSCTDDVCRTTNPSKGKGRLVAVRVFGQVLPPFISLRPARDVDVLQDERLFPFAAFKLRYWTASRHRTGQPSRMSRASCEYRVCCFVVRRSDSGMVVYECLTAGVGFRRIQMTDEDRVWSDEQMSLEEAYFHERESGSSLEYIVVRALGSEEDVGMA